MQNVNTFSYFAAHAPEIPEWFVHNGEPRPCAPSTVDNAEIEALPQNQRVTAMKILSGMLDRHQISEAAKKSQEMLRFAEQWGAYQKALYAWQSKDGMDRLVEWRWTYAQAMEEYPGILAERIDGF